MKKIIIIALLLLCITMLGSCSSTDEEMALEYIGVLELNNGQFPIIPVYIAETTNQQITGMLRYNESPKNGILFVDDEYKEWNMHMDNMKFAIDILYLEDIGEGKFKIISITKAEPNKTVPPEYADAVLELPRGVVEKARLTEQMIIDRCRMGENNTLLCGTNYVQNG